MSMTLTPPPAAGGPATDPQPGPPQPRSSARVVAILAIVLGAVLLLGGIASTAVTVLRTAGQGQRTLTATAGGIGDLRVDVSAADLTVVYEGDEVRLDVTGHADDWRLERDGETVSVQTHRAWWGGWGLWDAQDQAVLTLPRALERTELDARVSLSASALRADARFGAVDLDLSAGSADLGGSARSLDARLSAGRLAFDLDGVATADLRLSAGEVVGAMTGDAPREVALEASAGRIDLTLPDETYAVTENVDAGSVDNRLTVDRTSPNRVSVDVSAGQVTLRS